MEFTLRAASACLVQAVITQLAHAARVTSARASPFLQMISPFH